MFSFDEFGFDCSDDDRDLSIADDPAPAKEIKRPGPSGKAPEAGFLAASRTVAAPAPAASRKAPAAAAASRTAPAPAVTQGKSAGADFLSWGSAASQIVPAAPATPAAPPAQGKSTGTAFLNAAASRTAPAPAAPPAQGKSAGADFLSWGNAPASVASPAPGSLAALAAENRTGGASLGATTTPVASVAGATGHRGGDLLRWEATRKGGKPPAKEEIFFGADFL
eukprot:1898652-Prymnesium_polylepis.1